VFTIRQILYVRIKRGDDEHERKRQRLAIKSTAFHAKDVK